MNPYIKFVAVVIFVILVTSTSTYLLKQTTESQEERMAEAKNNTPQTRYENEVLEYGNVNVLIGSDYYRIVYIDHTGSMIKKNFNYKGDLNIVQSNITKIVVENPECCLYSSKYTLYADFE